MILLAFKITEDCIECGACIPVCPNEAITEGSPYVIDPEKCTECVPVYDTQQCASVCAVDAPQPDPDHVETREQLEAKYKRLHP